MTSLNTCPPFCDPPDPDGNNDLNEGGTPPGGNSDGSAGQGGIGDPNSYAYEVITSGMVAGCAYAALYSSSTSGEGCVAVFSRGMGFNAFSSSLQSYRNSASCYGALGFVSYQASSQELSFCVSSVHDTNYAAIGSSSTSLKNCASIFPTELGVYANKTSSFILDDFESMTYWWGSIVKTPTMFRSSQRSFINSRNASLGKRQSIAGTSGSVADSDALRFLWTSIASSAAGVPNITSGNTAPGPGSTAAASYRFVPVEHSLDWAQGIGTETAAAGGSSTSTTIDPASLIALVSSRNGYESVKPPLGIRLPEDRSGSTLDYSTPYSYSIINSGLWS